MIAYSLCLEGIGPSLYLLRFFSEDFLTNHSRMYFTNGLEFQPAEVWLNRISKRDRCEISKNIASLPDLKIVVDGTWYPTHEEFIEKYCPEFLETNSFFVNNLLCNRVHNKAVVYQCVWN